MGGQKPKEMKLQTTVHSPIWELILENKLISGDMKYGAKHMRVTVKKMVLGKSPYPYVLNKLEPEAPGLFYSC